MSQPSFLKMKLKFSAGILLLVFARAICVDDSGNEKNEVGIHHLMTETEKRMIFGSHTQIPKYEVLYPIDISARNRRHVGGFGDDVKQDKIIHLHTKNGKLSIRLDRRSNIMTIPLKVETRETDGRFVRSVFDHSDCHYHGKVDGFADSLVAVSHCNPNEMRAIMHLNNEDRYVIVPVPRRLREKRNLEESENLQGHIVYKSSIGSSCALHSKGLQSYNEFSFNTKSYPKDDLFTRDSKNSRWRRHDRTSIYNKTMETSVFVDDDLYSLMETEYPDNPIEAILGVVFAMINSVQIIYSQSSLSAHIRIILVKIVIMKPGSRGPSKSGGNIRSYLKSFCTWQAKYNPRNDDDADHWDHALMLTGKDLYMEKPENTVVIGLAWVSGMCYRNYSCSLNEGTTFESVYVISHELGHNLGMQHDGEDNNTCSENNYIMSSSLGPGKTTWSSCSNEYLNTFLGSEDSECLNDLTLFKEDLDYRSTILPGQQYSASTQCHLTFGDKYKPYITEKKPFEDLCRELWCANGTLARRAHPALAGTKCGVQKICLHGKCADKESVLSELDSSSIFPQEAGTDNSISL